MNRLAHFSVIYGGSAIILKGLGFLLSLWLARALTPDSYGVWGLMNAFQTGIMTFCLVGIQEAVVGQLRNQHDSGGTSQLYSAANAVFIRTTGLTLIIAAICGAIFLAPRNINPSGIAGVLVSGALLAFTALQAQMARLEENHLASLNFSFVLPMIGILGSFIAFVIYHSIESFFIGSAAATIFATLLLQGRLIGRTLSGNRVLRRKIMHGIAPFVVIALFGWLSGYGNTFFVDHLFEPTEVARLTFALTIGVVLQLAATAMNQVWSPHFFSLIRTQSFEIAEQGNQRFFNVQGLVLGVLAALCIVGLPPVLQFVGGNLTAYASMQVELLFVCAGYIVLAPWYHCQNYFLVFNKGKLMLRVVLITSAFGLTAWFMLMWLLGPLGIYLGFFIQMLLRSLGIVYFARRQWPVRIGWGGVAAGVLLASTACFI